MTIKELKWKMINCDEQRMKRDHVSINRTYHCGFDNFLMIFGFT